MAREAPEFGKLPRSWAHLYQAKEAFVCVNGSQWEKGKVLMDHPGDCEAWVVLDRGNYTSNVFIDDLNQVRFDVG